MGVSVRDTQAALDILALRMDNAAKGAAGDAARKDRDRARGLAPHLSGALAGSILVDGPRNINSMTGIDIGVPRGEHVYAAKVGPTVVYGRIREIGGAIPGRRTVMTHPYLRWTYNGHYVFKKHSPQKGTKYLLRATAATIPYFNKAMVRRGTAAISMTGLETAIARLKR